MVIEGAGALVPCSKLLLRKTLQTEHGGPRHPCGYDFKLAHLTSPSLGWVMSRSDCVSVGFPSWGVLIAPVAATLPTSRRGYLMGDSSQCRRAAWVQVHRIVAMWAGARRAGAAEAISMWQRRKLIRGLGFFGLGIRRRGFSQFCVMVSLGKT